MGKPWKAVWIVLVSSLMILTSVGGQSHMVRISNGGRADAAPAPIRVEADKWAIVPRLRTAPVIDGRPDEEIWRQAAVLNGFATAFYEQEALHKAEYRAAYDDRHLYISGTLARPAADTLAQIELVIRPAGEREAFYAVRIPIESARPPAIQTVWNPAMYDINASADQGRRTVEAFQYRTAADEAALHVEAAIPITAISPGGVPDGTEWRLNVIHVQNLYSRPLDSWVPIRNSYHWHDGGQTARLNGDVIGQERLGSLFFSRVPERLAPAAGGNAVWSPMKAELAYTGFTAKRLKLLLPYADAAARDMRLLWKEPGGDWSQLAIGAWERDGLSAAIAFQHPAPRTDGTYQLMIAFSPAASAAPAGTKVAILTFDREHAIAAGIAANEKRVSPDDVGSVPWSEPSENVRNALALIPEQPGFLFVGLPEMPELYPQSMYQLSADGQSLIAQRTGTVYPNAKFPENKELVTTNALGETVTIPYHEDAAGRKYFLSAHKWYLQKGRAIAQTAAIARTDPLGAARLLNRFADAYKGYNPTVDRVGGANHINASANKASGPPYAYWGGVWDRWWYNDLNQMRPLLNAYVEVKKTDAFKQLSAALGEDVERKIVHDMFIPSAEYTLTHVNRYSNMSLEPWTGLVAVGKAIGEPDYIHRIAESLESFTARMFLSDGFWQEVTQSYHLQTVNGLQKVTSLLRGWSDPDGYISPRTGLHFDNLDMEKQFPIIGRAMDISRRLVYPDGKVLPVMDTWAYDSVSQPKTDEGPLLLPSTGIGRLTGGKGPGQTMLYMGFQPKYGHVHWDPLNLNLYANRQELLPDLGYSHNTKYRWFTLSTMGHNTVVVDSKNMVSNERSKNGGNVEAFVQGAGAFQAMRASYESAYPGTEEYSREPWYVPFPDGTGERGYVLDLFRVSGGSRHEYTLQGDANRDAVFRTDMQLTDYGPYLLPPGTNVVEPANNSDSGRAEGHYPGYIHVRNVKRAQLEGDRYTLSLMTEQDGQKRTNMSITGLLEPGSNELYLGRSPSLRSVRVIGRTKDNNDEADKYDMPKLVLRRDGTNLKSAFVTVMEPYVGERPRIESIERLKPEQAPEGAVAVKIAYGDITDILLSNPHHPDQPLVAGDVTMRGQMGLIRLVNGQVREMTLSGGTLLKKGARELTGPGTVAGSITDTWRRAKGDAYDALVTDIPVPPEAIGQYVIVTHPDRSTSGFRIGNIVQEQGKTAIVLAEHDPGFELRADGSSEQMFYPSKRWQGIHTFSIPNLEHVVD
ncbi:hypothetical protein FE783_21345 [Paenibacillus mesophilus]|uniref:heparinase II/III domain-containing protein n=1 Tax=Paenibacillus mesophilus TaxID=2582849 RepID=UPI00110F3877|nr:heparinase II/III family protein [Paenibacillus mesophilus]TMV47546.1 hypothetical protein FE783_21345 [Paenibacillus mesophilus]